MDERGRAVDHAGEGERAQRVKGGLRQADPAHQPEAGAPRRPRSRRPLRRPSRPRTPDDRPEGAVVARRELDHPDHQRDPDGVVRAGLALEDRARPAAHLAAAEDGERDGRVGRGERRAEEAAGDPGETEQPMRRRPRSAPAVRTCRGHPSESIGTSARRSRRQPISMPPSKRITTSATTAIRSTVTNEIASRRPGQRSEAAAATTRKRAALGIASRSVSRRAEQREGEARRDDEHDLPEGCDLVHPGHNLRSPAAALVRLHFPYMALTGGTLSASILRS